MDNPCDDESRFKGEEDIEDIKAEISKTINSALAKSFVGKANKGKETVDNVKKVVMDQVKLLIEKRVITPKFIPRVEAVANNNTVEIKFYDDKGRRITDWGELGIPNYVASKPEFTEYETYSEARPTSDSVLKRIENGFNLVSGLNEVKENLRGAIIDAEDAERANELLQEISQYVKIATKP